MHSRIIEAAQESARALLAQDLELVSLGGHHPVRPEWERVTTCALRVNAFFSDLNEAATLLSFRGEEVINLTLQLSQAQNNLAAARDSGDMSRVRIGEVLLCEGCALLSDWASAMSEYIGNIAVQLEGLYDPVRLIGERAASNSGLTKSK